MNTVILLTLCQAINVGASNCRDVQLGFHDDYVNIVQCQMSPSTVQWYIDQKLREPQLRNWQRVGKWKCVDGDQLRQTAKI